MKYHYSSETQQTELPEGLNWLHAAADVVNRTWLSQCMERVRRHLGDVQETALKIDEDSYFSRFRSMRSSGQEVFVSEKMENAPK